MAASVLSHAGLGRQRRLLTHRGDRHQQLLLCLALGMAGMSTDSPELLAAKRLLDAAKAAGFAFCRIAPGEDGPLVGRRDTIGYQDEIYLGGFGDSCSAVRRHRWSLVVPGGLPIERALERAGVPLFAANEPITLTGSRAQRILQRRINQSVAEYEVLNTLEQSWGGLCTHVREGWNIGKPPYGYRAKTYRHPNPAKADKGQTKSRLEPDGALAETVTQIALWRYHDRLGYDTIAERLNADPARYPPPIPPGKTRARGAWGKTSVYEILRNPKYTGYQVFNRRASRSGRQGQRPDQMGVVCPTSTRAADPQMAVR